MNCSRFIILERFSFWRLFYVFKLKRIDYWENNFDSNDKAILKQTELKRDYVVK